MSRTVTPDTLPGFVADIERWRTDIERRLTGAVAGVEEGGGGGSPTGSAGGVLAGSYPNPSFAQDMATQAELNAVAQSKRDNVSVHIQSSAATVWTVTHGLGRRPAVVVTDSVGKRAFINVVDSGDMNTITITWPYPMTGRVYFA